MNSKTYWTTRPERTSDTDAIYQINKEAFGRLDEADLVNALRSDDSWIDGLSMVSLDGEGKPIGHALLTRCKIDNANALCLAPCAVLPDYQGQGAGSAAIESALRAAAELGEDVVTVLGSPAYYSRFGFEKSSTHDVSLAIEVPEENLMVLSLQGNRQLPSGVITYAGPFGM